MAAICKTEREPSPRIKSASTLILDSPASRTLSNKCLLLKLLSLWYFSLAAQADYDRTQYMFLNEGLEILFMSFFLVQKCHGSTISCFMILFPLAFSHTLFKRIMEEKENNYCFQW